jgi:EAL domain-containing protein (putative c-di-GMP-specific phosphodiesterase class I)/ActR/RegA family two-component response regulator
MHNHATPMEHESGRVLVCDDDPEVCSLMERLLNRSGYETVTVQTTQLAIERVRAGGIGVVVTDILMPGSTGLDLLKEIRIVDAELPVILVTGTPTADTAVQALRLGATGYLSKPFTGATLSAEVGRAERMRRLALLRRELKRTNDTIDLGAIQDDMQTRFDSALDKLHLVFQPIIRWSTREIYGYEALMRSAEPAASNPGVILELAEQLNGVRRLGRCVRQKAADTVHELPAGALLFVNLHARDLIDDSLYDPAAPLAQHAKRVVLEITERANMEGISDLEGRLEKLSAMGYRLALDDMGAGYSSLSSLATIEPDIIKIDMTLVRDVHQSPMKQRLVSSLAKVCSDLGVVIVSEGVETVAERTTLEQLGCDLFQGYLFARPNYPPPAPKYG